MKSSEAFGVVVRSVGLILVVSALGSLISALAAPGVLLLAIPTLFVGLWLLRGAPGVIDYAYPDRDREDHGNSRARDIEDRPE